MGDARIVRMAAGMRRVPSPNALRISPCSLWPCGEPITIHLGITPRLWLPKACSAPLPTGRQVRVPYAQKSKAPRFRKASLLNDAGDQWPIFSISLSKVSLNFS
jgi:hypothetical protein